jgi:hypothetical protein
MKQFNSIYNLDKLVAAHFYERKPASRFKWVEAEKPRKRFLFGTIKSAKAGWVIDDPLWETMYTPMTTFKDFKKQSEHYFYLFDYEFVEDENGNITDIFTIPSAIFRFEDGTKKEVYYKDNEEMECTQKIVYSFLKHKMVESKTDTKIYVITK